MPCCEPKVARCIEPRDGGEQKKVKVARVERKRKRVAYT